MFRVIDGGITAPQGFKATGRHIGIKKVKKDMSLITSDVPAIAAGVYTTSVVKAAHILWDREITKNGGMVKGLVAISGNANACTGEKGIRDNELMAEHFAKSIGAKKEEILTAATGIIGLDMPMDTILKGIDETYPHLSHKREEAKNAASGIITTDTFIKEMALQLNICGKQVIIGGMAKGSGMIHPNMATVLSFITTDINISRELLQKALYESVKDTYNMISVDGATSTNDMALVIANKMAGNPEITEEDEFYEEFKNAPSIKQIKKIAKSSKKSQRQIVKQFEKAAKEGKKVAKKLKIAGIIISIISVIILAIEVIVEGGGLPSAVYSLIVELFIEGLNWLICTIAEKVSSFIPGIGLLVGFMASWIIGKIISAFFNNTRKNKFSSAYENSVKGGNWWDWFLALFKCLPVAFS